MKQHKKNKIEHNEEILREIWSRANRHIYALLFRKQIKFFPHMWIKVDQPI